MRREPDDVSEEDSDSGIRVRDRPLAGEESRGDRFRKHIQQQRIGPVLLDLERVCLLVDDDVLEEDPTARLFEEPQSHKGSDDRGSKDERVDEEAAAAPIQTTTVMRKPIDDHG